MLCIIAAFIAQSRLPAQQTARFILQGWSVTELAGYMWFHIGYLHVISNLVFLWVFGNAVCSKLGNGLYLLVYMSGGLAAGIAHLIFDGRPVLGASGALNAVIGIYLVLYPFHSIRCLFIFVIYLRRFSIAGFWVILWWFALNVLAVLTGYTAKAYVAHVGGFISGVVFAVILVKTRVVLKDSSDAAIIRSLNL
jgi:membrane associated rhomboid family serine protease